MVPSTIDARIHHHWRSQAELTEFMARSWRHYVGRLELAPLNPYQNPEGDWVTDGPATEPSALADFLSSGGIARAVLGYDQAGLVPPLANHHLAREVCRAANGWTVERWLSGQDERLYGLVLVPNQIPSEGAREIRRVGKHPRIVGALLAGNGGGRPFGHPYYDPIYSAASDLGLPIVVEAGGDVTPDSYTQPAGGGWPLTFGEFAALTASSVMTHLVSYVAEGTFERFKNLRVLFCGAGAAWLPTLVWRFDAEWKALRRDVPWVRRLPSEYVQDHILVATQPLNTSAGPQRVQRLLRAYAGIESLLCYASGYPRWNHNSPADTEPYLGADWRDAVMAGNAEAFYRWPDQARVAVQLAGTAAPTSPQSAG